MDLDDFLKITESISNHNMNNFIYDRDWSLLSGLCHNLDNPKENNSQGKNTNEFNEEEKEKNKEKNFLKILR
jgi:hypothetical protein